jgi:hypothetical protein
MSAFQVVSFHNILFLELIHILGHKVTNFFEYTQEDSKKYSFFCTYTFFFVPLQSQIRAIGLADIILKAFISACFGTLKLGNFR